MLRLATDADVHGDIIRGLRRRFLELDLVRANDALPIGTEDPDVLAWAADAGRVLITNDRKTMIGFVHERLFGGLPVPGVIVTNNDQRIGEALNDLEVIVGCMAPEEARDRCFVFLPFRG